ncbi:hypothetical protein OLMES_0447 [Oleiphilus messinensis]|uniref:Uncharacterized protein n=1 Tax=Oleiphilus messinensis TaxID=141451 RepID=A0A1Y0I2C6_9GAMM|nr:hypothetical protein OLMES_0447 [Oleiphilus messinensis]
MAVNAMGRDSLGSKARRLAQARHKGNDQISTTIDSPALVFQITSEHLKRVDKCPTYIQPNNRTNLKLG